jgi:rubredoxin
MIVAQDLTQRRDGASQVVSRDIFLCPVCGSIGVCGEFGFSCTERPSWFRCEACQYVFGVKLPRTIHTPAIPQE